MESLRRRLQDAIDKSKKYGMTIGLTVDDIDRAYKELNTMDDNVETGYISEPNELEVVGWKDDSECESCDWKIVLTTRD